MVDYLLQNLFAIYFALGGLGSTFVLSEIKKSESARQEFHLREHFDFGKAMSLLIIVAISIIIWPVMIYNLATDGWIEE